MTTVTPPRIRPIPVSLRRGWSWSNIITAAILGALIAADLSIQPALGNLVQIGLLIETALPLVLLAVAQTFVVLVGGIDLSVGGVYVVTNAITVTWVGLHGGAHQWLLVVALGFGVAMGALNGLLVVRLGFQPFIATLGTWTIFNGIALTILPTDGGSPPPLLSNLLLDQVAGIPSSIVILAGIVVAWRLLRASRFGMRMYAVGADEERARLNGTPVRTVKLCVYVIAGLCAALAGIYAAGANASGTPTGGDAYILTSVAAVVIGGTSLRGGEGGVGMTVMGAMSLTLINDIVGAENLNTWVSVAAASALLLAMVIARTLIGAALARRRT
ncbi:MAG TPA: ABC transporter permease [Solirubrobacteraceae bacterium]|nr:ABC transporter permease [Solirubrobacteraceae bacterium]